MALAEAEPSQFDAAGNAKAKTPAAKRADEQRALRRPDASWAERRKLLAARTQAARKAVAQFKVEHLEELAAELEPRARAAVADIEAALQNLVAATRSYSAVSGAYSELLRPVQGLDGSDLPPALWVATMSTWAQKALGKEVRPPLPRSLYPEGATPPKTKTAAGWVSGQYVSDEEAA